MITNRVRTKGGFTDAPFVYTEQRYGTCSLLSWDVVSGPSAVRKVGEYHTMTDTLTPHFRRLQSEGKVAFNPMTKSIVKSAIIDVGAGHWNALTTPTCSSPVLFRETRHEGPYALIYRFRGAYFNDQAPIPPIRLVADDELSDAIAEVSTKVLAERGKADNNLFESLAEYRQTLSLTKNATSSLWKWAKANEKQLLTKVTEPANLWLIYRYGIRPFISDVEAITKGLSKRIGKSRKTSRAQVKIDRNANSDHDTGSDYASFRVFFNQQTVDTLTIRGMALDEYMATSYSNIGLTAKGLLSTPWELIPYSFVLDWMLNVGDFINAMLPAPGYENLGSALTIARQNSTVYTCTNSINVGSATVMIRSASGSFIGTEETKTRGQLATPRIVVKNDFRFSEATRTADAIALITQKLATLLSGNRKVSFTR